VLKFLKRMIAIPSALDSCDNQRLAWKGYAEAGPILKALNLDVDLSGGRLLDVGCGLGGKSVYYAEQGAHLVVGVDISEARARVAAAFARRHRAAGAKVQIVVADAAHLPFPGGIFDAIISIERLYWPY
jgi:cyclopropane fatty-acyl-phospholipid synthase-like methyltransferase